MTKKCEECGKSLNLVTYNTYVDDETGKVETLCRNCFLDRENKESVEVKEKKIETNIRLEANKGNLSLPELQLKRLTEIKLELIAMKNDIHTISAIVLILFTLMLIGLLMFVFIL